jgi:hypothetical protein
VTELAEGLVLMKSLASEEKFNNWLKRGSVEIQMGQKL